MVETCHLPTPNLWARGRTLLHTLANSFSNPTDSAWLFSCDQLAEARCQQSLIGKPALAGPAQGTGNCSFSVCNFKFPRPGRLSPFIREAIRWQDMCGSFFPQVHTSIRMLNNEDNLGLAAKTVNEK
jgi:hypothetical protein